MEPEGSLRVQQSPPLKRKSLWNISYLPTGKMFL